MNAFQENQEILVEVIHERQIWFVIRKLRIVILNLE